MGERKRLRAEAVAEISAPETGEVVGWLYRWDNGSESQIMVTDIPPGLINADCLKAEVGHPGEDDDLEAQAVA